MLIIIEENYEKQVSLKCFKDLTAKYLKHNIFLMTGKFFTVVRLTEQNSFCNNERTATATRKSR